MIKAFKSFILICSLLSTTIVPSIAASDHDGGQIRVRWTTTDMVLNASSYLEQEFIPTNTTSFVDGAAFRWANQYHFDFCWQGKSSLLTNDQRCGYVGFGLGSKNGNNYYGNFDFAIFNAIEYQTLRTDSNINCSNSANSGIVEGKQTYYMNCWKSIIIQMGTPYILRVQYDPTNTSTDNNWWSASIKNKNSGEVVTIGKIRAFGNSYQEQLTNLETVIFYGGNPTACDMVPIMDLRVLPIRNSQKNSTFLNSWNASCVRATIVPSKEFPGYFSIRLGGELPESREPGYTGPTASAKPSASPSPILKKPNVPIFSGINITGNTININVNLNTSKPDNVYLIAPTINNNSMEEMPGKINGDTASWQINFDPRKITGTLPLRFVSVKDGSRSEETLVEYLLPSSIKNKVSKVPNSPTRIKTKLLGTQILISASINTSGDSAAEKVYMYSKVLGITKKKPIYGDLLSNSVVFTVPVSNSQLSKSIDINLVAMNNKGESKVATTRFAIPIPKSPANSQIAQTIICYKGSTIRTFLGKSCPPGWKTQ